MIFKTTEITVTSAKQGLIEVDINMDERDIIQYANIDKLLEEIGLDAVLKHFDHREFLSRIGE